MTRLWPTLDQIEKRRRSRANRQKIRWSASPSDWPASTLNTARALAADRGVKVTALIREWVEQQLADNTDDQRVVSVAELRRLIAHAS